MVTAKSLWDLLMEFLKKQSRAALFTEAVVVILVIGFIDYITGYELAVYPFYAVPILLVALLGDRRAALALSVLSAAVWWEADAAAGHIYSREWLRLWEATVRLMFFSLVTIVGSAAKQHRDATGARIELLERSRQLEQEIISISERERHRIGRDLHDGLCQYLAAIGLTADLLRQNLAGESHPRAKAAGEIGSLLQDAVERTRELARGLSPVDRDEGGLESALEELASSTSRLTGISCVFISPAPVEVDDNLRATHLFRIAQESIGNAMRHGRARSIVIALESADGDLSLRISDDGSGFDPANCGRNGMGLNIMRYRARVTGGNLEIYPNSPSGTVVSFTINQSTTHPSIFHELDHH